MGDFPRKADGRRIFTAMFKRGVMQQIVKGEKILAEVSRELDIQPTVIRQWKRRVGTGAATAVAAYEDLVPASLLRAAQGRISAAWAASRWKSRSCKPCRRYWAPEEYTGDNPFAPCEADVQIGRAFLGSRDQLRLLKGRKLSENLSCVVSAAMKTEGSLKRILASTRRKTAANSSTRPSVDYGSAQ